MATKSVAGNGAESRGPRNWRVRQEAIVFSAGARAQLYHARLTFVGMLVTAALLGAWATGRGLPSPALLATLAAYAAGCFAVHHGIGRRSRPRGALVVQLGLDMALVTAGLVLSGSLWSPFLAFYLLVIATTTILFGEFAGAAATLWSLVLYAGAGVAQMMGWLPPSEPVNLSFSGEADAPMRLAVFAGVVASSFAFAVAIRRNGERLLVHQVQQSRESRQRSLVERIENLNSQLARLGFEGTPLPEAALAAGPGSLARGEAMVDDMALRLAREAGRAKARDAQRREALALVAHDLRGPLATLVGYLETLELRDDSLPLDARRNYLSASRRHAERLSEMIAELLQLAELESPERALRAERFDLAELAQDVVQKYALQARAADVSLRTRIGGAPALIDGEIALLERALDNLLANSLRHTPAGGVIELETGSLGQRILLTVSDTGAGVDPAIRERLFQPFVRSGKKPEQPGLGLGLAIVRRVAELHGGEVRLVERVGRGSAVELSLPRR